MKKASLLSLLLIPALAVAQNDSTETDSLAYELETVVVTGTRTPKLLSNSPILTRVISQKDIRQSDATNISDLLQTELPGIEFSYSMNQQVSLNMQGFGGNSVLFLVDGERLAGETLDNVDYSRLNLENAGRVEIVKGGASALYGSNAVGGVVNIITRDDKDPWRLNVNARYGEHNEQRYGLSASFNKGIINSTTTAQYYRIDSYDMKNSGDYSQFYGGYNYNVRERITIQPLEQLKITGRAGFFFRERDSAPTTHDRYRDFSAGLRGIYDFKKGQNLELSYSFDQYDKSDFLKTSNRDVRKYSNVQNAVRAIYNHTFMDKHILTVGADLMRDYLKSYQFSDPGHRSQLTADALAQLDINFTEKFDIILGARYDYFSEASMKHLSSRASVMYKVGRCNIRGSYAGSFRAPTLKEMYMDFDMAGIFMIYGNPDLKPESGHNFQISTEYTRGSLNFNVGGFCNLVSNRITTAWSQALKGQLYTNINDITIAGAEANFSYRHSSGIGTRLCYVYTHEHVPSGEPYTASTRPHTATVRLDYNKSWGDYALNVGINGRILSAVTVDEYTSLTDYSEIEKVRYPAYTMWKLTATGHIYKGIDLTLSVNNLFNYVPKYYYSNSPTTNGISVAAGISIDIDNFFR